MSPDSWAALGTWATALVAAVAAVFALRQLREARITREKQAQPNVVAFVRPNAKVWQFLDLVVANYGLTPAYHVKLDFPPLTVSPYTNNVTGENTTELYLPDELAVLAPGQEWHTMWDSAISREDKRDELGSRFVGEVRFEDQDKKQFRSPSILDWNTFWNTMQVADKPDESAKALAKQLGEIASVLKSYTVEHQGIWTYLVPAEVQQQWLSDRQAERNAVHDRIARALHGDKVRDPDD